MSNKVLIIIAGGSASGKTTVVNRLRQNLNCDDVIVISHDDYYKDQSHLKLEDRYLTNYDHPSSLDNDLLFEDLKSLLDNKEIVKPTYDFINHTRSEKKEIIKPTKVIILEGILALEDKRIRDLSDIKIFVTSDDDIRFIRRLKRDISERGRSLESVIEQYTKTVKPMYYEFVKPTRRFADVIIPNHESCDVGVDILMTKIKDILR